jgi:hypothetical protein
MELETSIFSKISQNEINMLSKIHQIMKDKYCTFSYEESSP